MVTWIDVPETMVTGEAITVTVKGFYAMEGYRYKDAAELKAAARPLEGVGLAYDRQPSGYGAGEGHLRRHDP